MAGILFTRNSKGHLGWPPGAASRPSPGCLFPPSRFLDTRFALSFSGGPRDLMFSFAWLTIRQAQEALKHGRLEEAQRLLGQPAAQGHQRTWELSRQLARALVERGVRHLRQDDPNGAWG